MGRELDLLMQSFLISIFNPYLLLFSINKLRMPAYHTTQVQQMPSVGNMGVLALRGNTKGPAPQIQEEDIIDEAIKYFKANVFFKSFSPENDADRLFIYVTLWIQECLKVLQKAQSRDDGWKSLYSKSVQDFAIPGDSSFPINAYFHKPRSSQEAQKMKDYLKQVRLETATRMLDVALDASGKPSKWWMCFTKRKFLGLSLSGPGY